MQPVTDTQASGYAADTEESQLLHDDFPDLNSESGGVTEHNLASQDLGVSQLLAGATLVQILDTDSILMPPPPKPIIPQTAARSVNGRAQLTDKQHHDLQPRQTQDNVQNGVDGSQVPDRSNNEIDPAQPLEEYDWAALEKDYSKMLSDKDKEYASLLAESKALQDFYQIWCDVGSKRETERMHKRHITQKYYVQQREHEVDEDRKHYITVLNAFHNAGRLLEQ